MQHVSYVSSIIMKSNYIRRPSFYLILPCQDNVRAIMTYYSHL